MIIYKSSKKIPYKIHGNAFIFSNAFKNVFIIAFIFQSRPTMRSRLNCVRYSKQMNTISQSDLLFLLITIQSKTQFSANNASFIRN